VEDDIEGPSEDDVPLATPLLVDILGNMVELLVEGVPAPLASGEELEMLMLEGLELPDGEVKAVVDDGKLLVEELPGDEVTIVDGVNVAAAILPEEVEEKLLTEDKVLPENSLLSDDAGPLCVEVEGELVEVVIMLLIEDDSIPVVKLLLVDNVKLLLEEEIVGPLPADVDEVPLAVAVAELLLVGEIVELPLVDGVEPLDDVEREVEVEVKLLELFVGKVSRSAPHTLVEDSCAPSPFLR